METYYCRRGCNVFETNNPEPECAACGSIMTTDQDAFEDAHERRELEQIAEIERRMAKFQVESVRWIELTGRWFKGEVQCKAYRIYLKDNPGQWLAQTNKDHPIYRQRRVANIIAKALSENI